jgi:hypothetical protein
MGEKVKRLGESAGEGETSSTRAAAEATPLDHQRAAAVLPVLAQILGVEYHAN